MLVEPPRNLINAKYRIKDGNVSIKIKWWCITFILECKIHLNRKFKQSCCSCKKKRKVSVLGNMYCDIIFILWFSLTIHFTSWFNVFNLLFLFLVDITEGIFETKERKEECVYDMCYSPCNQLSTSRLQEKNV